MTPKPYQPFVPENTKMQEFTLRAVLLGLVLTVVLGAANAYLGLRAGQTIAATYPAAVISMAALRLRGGTILEENLARTAGSIGESIAAGAIFTIPAFVISRAWPSFDFEHAYWKSTALMMMGGILGVLFVSLVRRVMVEDPELPFPESLAAAEIHKAGQRGGEAAKYLFYNMAFGGVSFLLGAVQPVRAGSRFLLPHGRSGPLLRAPGRRRNGEHAAGGRREQVRRAQREPGVHRRGIRDRAATGVAECRRQRAGVGAAGPAADLFPRSRRAEVCSRAATPTNPGTRWPTVSGASSCGRSRWAA